MSFGGLHPNDNILSGLANPYSCEKRKPTYRQDWAKEGAFKHLNLSRMLRNWKSNEMRGDKWRGELPTVRRWRFISSTSLKTGNGSEGGKEKKKKKEEKKEVRLVLLSRQFSSGFASNREWEGRREGGPGEGCALSKLIGQNGKREKCTGQNSMAEGSVQSRDVHQATLDVHIATPYMNSEFARSCSS